jgi:hypothetical protein
MSTSLEKWKAITQDPRVVSFFTGLFERVGIRVTDTQEAFTCIHHGDRIDFEATLDRSKVDYVVELESWQIDRMVAYAEPGELSLYARYRIIRALFTPATAATLKNPVLSNDILRRFARVEDLIHVFLTSPVPEQEEDASHTLIYVKGQWLVIPDLHGNPRRTFRMTLEEAITYHKRVFAAMKADKWSTWWQFARWYQRWRKSVSVLH